jgi:hypothetical protein
MKLARLYTALVCMFPFVMGVQAESRDTPALSLLENGFVANSCAQDARQWVRCFHQKPEVCEEIVRGRFHVCMEKYAGDINSNMTQPAMQEMSMKLARCFRAEFLDRYGAARVQSAECAKVLE